MRKRQNAQQHMSSRRDFFKTLAKVGACGIVGASALGVPGSRVARAITAERKHFISIAAMGGWDSYLGHQAMLTSHLGNLPVDDYTDLRSGSTLTRRFREDHIARVDDPRGGPRYMGPLWDDARMDDIFDKMAIWRGLVKEAEHDIGNNLLHHGSLSSYAASFSALIAKDLALDYPRPLHYVQVSTTTEDLHMGSGLIDSAYGIPTHIPDMATWQSLTNKSSSNSDYRRAFVTSAVNNLSTTSITQALTSPGASVFEAFRNSYQGSLKVRDTNYASSSEFSAIVAKYKAAATDALNIAKSAGRYPTVSAIDVGNVINSNSSLFFGYALAEFLTVNDLSAVVVLPTPTGDNHEFDDNHYVNLALTYSCFRTLVQNLAKAQDVTRPGSSLLDCTTICMETEFDRTYDCSFLDASNRSRPGTNHGSSTSVIFAGARIQTGRVIGDVKTGATGMYAAFDEQPFANPLPIDPTLGTPSQNGVLFSQRALLPTLLSMFGIP
ncbi:MAG: DUF1501 domain-containing protein, partial [Proteobacteria bacterium]